MALLSFYDQIFTNNQYKETSLRKVILGTGEVEPEYNSASGINILYSINSTGVQTNVLGKSSTILGGKDHSLDSSSYSLILGGDTNQINSPDSANGDNSALIIGAQNQINTSQDSFIIGGTENVINSNAHGNAILNSAKVTIDSNSLNNTVIQVASGYINGKNNVALLGHNVNITNNSNFSVGANLTIDGENTVVFSDGRKPFKASLPNSFYIRNANGLIFTDFINIKPDNINSPIYGSLQSGKQNREIDYVSEYGGTVYLDGNTSVINDITGIRISVGYKSLPIIIGERSDGPILCDWSGERTGVVYRIPSNAINVGYDNSYNLDDVVIGNHNLRLLNKDRSLDKQSDPYSNSDLVIGSFNWFSGNNSILLGKNNQLFANYDNITIGNNNIASAKSVGNPDFISKEADAIDGLIMIGHANTEEIGLYSIILGESNYGISQDSISLGKENYISGVRTSVIGHSNRVSTDFTFVGGSSNNISTSQSNIIGRQNVIAYPFSGWSEDNEISFIFKNNILGNSNTSFGGRESSIIGLDNTLRSQAPGTGIPLRNTIIMGNRNLSSSSQSAVIGHLNNDYSVTVPDGNFNTFIFGSLNKIQQTDFSTAVGYANKISRITNGFALGVKNSVIGQQAKKNRAGLNPTDYANYNLVTGENTLALGFNALAEGSNKIIFGSYTKGIPKIDGEVLYNQNTQLFNQGMYQRAFLNWKGYYSAAGTNTIELTLDGIVPTGHVTASNYHRGRAYMPSGRVWNGFVNVMARKGLGSTESIWSQLRHVTIYRDQGASKPVVVSDTVLSTQSGNFVPANPSEFTVNFSGLDDYVVVTARGNNTSAGYASGVGINWHVVGDFAETITAYENSKGVLINTQADTQPEGYRTYQIYAS